MPKIRHVFTGSEEPQIAHLWMHKKQYSARNSGRSFYFEGDTIYSYGSHFPIARHVTNAKGKSAVLMTTAKYSSSTSRHISMTSSALFGTVLYADLYRNTDPFKLYEYHIREAAEKSVRARGSWHIDSWQRDVRMWIQRTRDYAKFYKLPIPKELKKLIKEVESPDAQEIIKKRLAERRAVEAKASAEKKEQERQRRRKLVQDIHEKILTNLPEILARYRETFKFQIIDDGKLKTLSNQYSNHLPPELTTHKYFQAIWPKGDLLRLGKTDDGKVRVLTSLGSQVGVRCAKAAYLELASRPEKICDYPVNMYAEEFIHIGCHKIYYEEIERFAKEQGWKN